MRILRRLVGGVERARGAIFAVLRNWERNRERSDFIKWVVVKFWIARVRDEGLFGGRRMGKTTAKQLFRSEIVLSLTSYYRL